MRRAYCIIFILILLGLYIFTNNYYIFILIFIYLLLLLCSVLLFLSLKVEIQIVLPEEIKKSEQAEIGFIIKNTSIFPIARLLFDVVCENALVNEKTRVNLSCSLLSKKTVKINAIISGLHIGKIDVSVTSVRIWDYFGIFSKSLLTPNPVSGYVYPSFSNILVDVNNLPEIAGEGERYFPGRRGRDINEPLTLRDYEPGDELRSIHWKLTSKMDRLIIRDFSLSVRYAVIVLLELITPKENSSELLDRCVDTALSISLNLIEKGINHNIAWYSDHVLNIREITNASELQLILPDILSGTAYYDTLHALEAYIDSDNMNKWISPVYVTTILDSERISEVAVRQPLTTYYISDEEDSIVAKNTALDILVVHNNDDDRILQVG